MVATRNWVLAIVAAITLGTPVIPRLAGQTTVMVGVKHKMRAILITPESDGPHPGILLLHTSGGLSQEDIDFGQRLAQQGYVVLVPAFLEAYGITARTRYSAFTTDAEAIFADFGAALDMLRQNPQVAGSKLGALGFSNGGYFAMWLAATGKVQAGVSYYGALSGAGTDKALDRFRAVFNRKSSPVLILHGMADQTVPVAAAQRLGDIVAAAGSSYEIHLYDGAGHRFDREPGLESTAEDAWQRTLAFLASNLKQS